MLEHKKKSVFLQPQSNDGAVAQLVEQRTENPCVTGSIPVSTTSPELSGLFYCLSSQRTCFQHCSKKSFATHCVIIKKVYFCRPKF